MIERQRSDRRAAVRAAEQGNCDIKCYKSNITVNAIFTGGNDEDID